MSVSLCADESWRMVVAHTITAWNELEFAMMVK